MICRLERQGDVAIVHIEDDIAAEVLEDFVRFFEDELQPEFTRIVLDMTEVEYFCSSALTVVIRTLRSARQAGGDLLMVACTPSVSRLMEVTRLGGIIRCFSDVEGALHHLEKRP